MPGSRLKSNSVCELQVLAKPQPVVGPAPPTPFSVSPKPCPLPGSACSLGCGPGRPRLPQQALPLSRPAPPTRPLLSCARPVPHSPFPWPPTYRQGLHQPASRPRTTPEEADFGCWSRVPYTAAANGPHPARPGTCARLGPKARRSESACSGWGLTHVLPIAPSASALPPRSPTMSSRSPLRTLIGTSTFLFFRLGVQESVRFVCLPVAALSQHWEEHRRCLMSV